MKKERRKKNKQMNRLNAAAVVFLILSGLIILWVASLRIPALEDIGERKISRSTKIYDRTGDILLYDTSRDVRRVVVPYEAISPYAIDATIAIEDEEFYNHNGVDIVSFIRAILINLKTASFSQGGSTITQQVVKNSILTNDKTPTRKLKEWILAMKLEKILSKEEIITLYLNEIPYGGTLYGIEEASRNFFGKPALDLTLAEASYLAAIPRAPTYYSPYGSHREDLEARKNQVLLSMLEGGSITQEEYETALAEEVEFKPKENNGSIKAPHFVFYVLDQLAKKYGEDALQDSGFKVITTLDYDLQKKAEDLALKYGEINQERFNADNNGIVAVDPKNGDILVMVGSRNYFDEDIQGNFNVTTAHRQPGSTFKPFVYVTMFNKGYTDSTVLFDIPIQFSTRCAPNYFVSDDICYAPGNYDDKFRGPMTIRNALAQSVNLPAVQGSYLAGVKESVATAKSMGIESLNDLSRLGLSLVLGGGEVSLLDMTSAYSVFANDGVRNPSHPILRIEDTEGNIIYRSTELPRRVLPEQSTRLITDILSDNVARTPGFGPNSLLYIPSRPVAVKTGTSNDYKDAWIVGYTPNLSVGAWVGNNDNTPMARRVSGLVVAPLWREYMDTILPEFPIETFIPPEPENLADLKPVLKGDWQTGGVHSILHWVHKDNPRGPIPSNPGADPQYENWEYAVRLWAGNFQPTPGPTASSTNPDGTVPPGGTVVPLPPIPNF